MKKLIHNLEVSTREIKHDCKDVTLLIAKCDCCGEDFYILLYPNVFVYSRFCPEHTNPYKRSRFQK